MYLEALILLLLCYRDINFAIEEMNVGMVHELAWRGAMYVDHKYM